MPEVFLKSTGPLSRSIETFDTFLAASDGAEVAKLGRSISSAADFHVRTSATLDSARVSRVRGLASGRNTSGSFAYYDPDTHLWRTWQRCLDGEWEEFSATWPNAGMTRNGIAYPLPPSVPFISGIGSFFWPTPTANARRSGGIDRWGGSNARKALKKRLGIDQEPAPAGMFTTLTADDTGHRKKPYSQGGEALSFQIGGPVNPEWAEWLMGFPIGWTELPSLETQ